MQKHPKNNSKKLDIISSSKRKKVAIIGTNGLPPRYGGFETLANYLTDYLKDSFDFIVYCSKTPRNQRILSYNNARLVYLPLKANGWQSIIYDAICILHAWLSADELLILGNSGAFILPLKVFFGKKIITNIGGIDWQRNKWNYFERKFIEICETICIRFSDKVITDNHYIQQLYKDRYACNSELIEYGGDQATKIEVTPEMESKYEFLGKRYFLSVNRAQSDNNIHMLLSVFEKLPQHLLVVISNWDSSEYGKKLKQQYKGRFSNIFIVDAIYDEFLLDMIRSNAWIYIHSQSFCGTAPSLVEVMNLGIPIICYGAKTNRVTTENKCEYFENELQLEKIILSLDNEKLGQIASDVYEIAKRRYRWSVIAREYARVLG